MAITRYSSFDVTVNTIADRNNISRKVNHMTVLVKDAIADMNAGSGRATYRWDSSDELWVLISRSTSDAIVRYSDCGTNFPIRVEEFNVFAYWFVTERNKFFL